MKTQMKKKVYLIILISILSSKLVYPCSAIVLKSGGQILLAKNFDWTYRDGIVVKNLRGTTKTAYFTHSGEPAIWTSKYGSVTFNQNGKEMPYGGMNEKGLVVEMLWLSLTQYNITAEKEYVNELEWIQYQLDHYKTVQEVMDHVYELKIFPIKGKIHYILTDTTGESVIIEYLNGQPIAYRNEANVCQAITNNSVLQSEPYRNQVKGIRKKNTAPTYRYYLLEQEIASMQDPSNISETYAFDVLKEVTIPKGDFKTVWSIVYNVTEKSVSFFTDTHKEIKTIHLVALDWDKNLSYFPLNQNQLTNLDHELKSFSEMENYLYMSPSLIHLGFIEAVTKDLSLHQFRQTKSSSSRFADHYFHFNLSIPIEEDKQTIFIAVMDSEEGFKQRKVVAGGYLFATFSNKGVCTFHIYGLRNGHYSMLAFIDSNKNRKLDFDKQKAVEEYLTFGNSNYTKEKEIDFANTSADFNKMNSNLQIRWRR